MQANLSRFRFPMALVGAFLVTMGLYAFLHLLISRRGEGFEVQQVMKIEFTRLRNESEIEIRKTEKAKQEKAEQAPPPPDITIQKSSIDLGGGGDIGAIQTLVH